MANETKYPKRGEMSADGKLYTHTDGSVHERADTTLRGWLMCSVCSLRKASDECDVSGIYPCSDVQVFKHIDGAYVPSADEQAACDMARAMIQKCIQERGDDCNNGEYGCADFDAHTCPARAYLAAHGDEKAWEVAT